MSSTRKRRVTLEQERGNGFQHNETRGNLEDKLMTRSSKRKKIASSGKNVNEETVEPEKPAAVEVRTGSKQSTRVKRQTWTSTGIGVFFEALAEHGKDFGKILNYMCAKEKKKKPRDPFIENLTKNQVRFFYYRTWHKVSSLLALADHEDSSPSQKSIRKEISSQVSVPSSDVVKGCGPGSDEETEGEGEPEPVFDMSLDEGDESQDGCPEHTSNVVLPEDGDSMPILCHQNDPSPVTPATVEASSLQMGERFSEKETFSVGESAMGDGGTSGGAVSDVEVGKGEKKKAETGAAGAMVKVNGVWQSLDLVAMICYSRMRQKCRAEKEVLGRKLNELIYKGTTTIRVKGKRKIQMKIPNCPALRNSKGNVTVDQAPSECYPSESLPKTLTIELRPFDSSSWTYVQHLSMNPRLRLAISSSRTVKDMFYLIASKWHILPKDIFTVLKLFSRSQGDKSVPSLATESPGSVRSGSTCISTGQTSEAGLQTCVIGNDGGLLQPIAVEPSMTLGALKVKLLNSKLHKLSLHYQLTFQQSVESSESKNLSKLLQIASVLASSYKLLFTPSGSPITPPSLMSTPTSHASITPTRNNSLLMSSPVVVQYIKNMPKKSPIKSPLAKYKRMKQSRPSPMKKKTAGNRIKPVQLQFPSSQVTNTPPYLSPLSSPATNVNTSGDPVESSGLCSIQSLSPSADQKSKTDKSGKDKGGGNQSSSKVQHVVTVSKSTLKHSGSFTRLRLDDLFKSVSENFKDAQLKSGKSLSSEATQTNLSTVSLPTIEEEDVPPGSTVMEVEPEADPTMEYIFRLTPPPLPLPPQPPPPPPPPSSAVLPNCDKEPLTDASKPSPLEKLASKVSFNKVPHTRLPPSQMGITIITTSVPTASVSRATTAVVSPSSRPAANSSSSTVRSSKRGRGRAIPTSQRPVVPKPLMYLPQFAQQLASLQKPPQPTYSQQDQTRNIDEAATSQNFIANATASLASSSQTTPLSTILPLSTSNTLTTEELLQAQVGLLQDLLTRPSSSQNPEKHQKQQQIVQAVLQSLLATGTQYPSLLQKLDLKALLSAAISSTNLGTGLPSVTKPQPSFTGLTTSSSLAEGLVNPSASTNPVSLPPFSTNTPSSSAEMPFSISPIGNSNNVPELIYTSTDTVAELLKGLSPNENELEKESVVRLSEETSDVLPNFARAMMEFRSNNNHTEHAGFQSLPRGTNEVSTTSPHGEKDSSGSTDTLVDILQMHHSEIADSNFKSIVDNTDYTEVFSQLRDILKTPERSSSSRLISNQTDGTDERPDLTVSPSQNRPLEGLLDIFNSPFKFQGQNDANQPDPVILEESSVDYISKFKELASAMNRSV